MSPDEAVMAITEAFISSMTIEDRDPWEFFDHQLGTWGYRQTGALQSRLREIIAAEAPPSMQLEHAVRITRTVFATTGVPFNETAQGLGEAAAEVFRSALRLVA
jgi:hypothetical protein